MYKLQDHTDSGRHDEVGITDSEIFDRHRAYKSKLIKSILLGNMER
jgi:hypothetical protein